MRLGAGAQDQSSSIDRWDFSCHHRKIEYCYFATLLSFALLWAQIWWRDMWPVSTSGATETAIGTSSRFNRVTRGRVFFGLIVRISPLP